MPESEFLAAGFSSDYYSNLKYIAHDEEAHVELLTSALTAAGATPVAACEYSFPYTDPKSFVSLASVLEGSVDSSSASFAICRFDRLIHLPVLVHLPTWALLV